jgi:hypothetical protein
MVTEATLITRDIEETNQCLTDLLLQVISTTPFPTHAEYLAMATVAQAFPIDREALRIRHMQQAHLVADASDAIVASLIDSGMLEESDEATVSLGPAGMRIFGAVREALTAASVRMHQNIPADDLATTRRTLGALRDAARREPSGGAIPVE